jgi:pyrimidine-nucleoside phosphorylase
MISGRGLGITGGTLDKLESIPGLQTALPRRQIELMVHEVGCVICGQTERMVPADKRLYALRDVTGTVPSVPLLVTSILSKKLAEGLQSLVLDVKFGCAAFMKTRQEARELARAMVTLGNECDVHTHALLSRMDTPLGKAVGNWLEIKEAAALLNQDSGPSLPDLEEVVLACAAHLLVQTGKARTVRTAIVEARKCLHSGQPRNKWEQMLQRQGADLPTYHKMLQMESQAAFMHDFCAARSGVVARCDARIIGEVVRDLGGGRLTQDSVLDLSVGLDKLAKPGDSIRKGSVLARIHSHDREGALQAREQLAKAFEISERARGNPPRVVETVTG